MHRRQAGPRNPAAVALGVLALLLCNVPIAWAASGPKVGIVIGNSYAAAGTDLKSRLDSSGQFSQVDVIDARTSSPSAATLKAYDGLLVVGDYYNYWADYKATESALVSYLDGGGGAV